MTTAHNDCVAIALHTPTIKSNLSHKEMAKHIRNRIKIAGIKARVWMQPNTFGDNVISVATTEYNVEFTNEEQKTIRQIAKSNDLTWVRGLEIDVDLPSDPNQMNFYMPRGNR
jgi:hypothetical protein